MTEATRPWHASTPTRPWDSSRRPPAGDGYTGPYLEHQLARIYILAGEHEKALDRLEPLLRTPYYLSPG